MLLSFFLFYGLMLLILAVIIEIFTPIAEIVILIETTIKEPKAEMETNPVIIEIIIRECTI